MGITLRARLGQDSDIGRVSVSDCQRRGPTYTALLSSKAKVAQSVTLPTLAPISDLIPRRASVASAAVSESPEDTSSEIIVQTDGMEVLELDSSGSSTPSQGLHGLPEYVLRLCIS